MGFRRLSPWALLSLAACTSSAPADEAPADGRAASAIEASRSAARPAFEVLLGWGEGDLEVGRRAPQPEHRGDGPSGIALTPDGRVLVVDRFNHRLVEVDAAGPRRIAALREDVEHLAVGDDGAIAAFSPLRSLALVMEADGAPVGEIAVPRLGPTVVGVRLGSSHQIELETALQERLVAGSPAAPRGEADFIRSKREGAAALDDGRGVVAIVRTGSAMLQVLSAPGKGRTQVVSQIEIGEGMASLRVLDVEGDLCAALVERVAQPLDAIEVSREVVVVDLAKGRVVGGRELPPPGDWVPTEDIAVGGSPLQIAWMTPEPDGLRVHRVPVGSLVARGGAK